MSKLIKLKDGTDIELTDEFITAIADAVIEKGHASALKKGISVNQISSILNIKPNAVRNHIKKGILPSFKINGSVMVKEKDFDNYYKTIHHINKTNKKDL